MNCPEGQIVSDLGCLPEDPVQFSAKIYGLGLSLIGVVALLSIMYGGFLILSSRGQPDQLRIGKSYIVYSLIGLVLGATGYALYQIVAVDVLKIPGFR